MQIFANLDKIDRKSSHLRTTIIFAATILIAIIGASHQALAGALNIAILEADKQYNKKEESINRLFRQEIKALFEGEHDISFTPYRIETDASTEDINALIDAAYKDDTVDYVLVVDIAANQLLGIRPDYQKPTFLPIVLNAQLLGYPETQEGGSGIKNLNYITQNINFE